MKNTELLNFRIPTYLKQQFQQTCKTRNVAMTSALNHMIFDYVANHTVDANEGIWEPIIFSSDEFRD
jgi:antitoxin component of RelBE/YafQ-DinJ toxin-antitoxin module